MKYSFSTLTRTGKNKTGRDIIYELEKDPKEYITIYWQHPITNELYPIIGREEDFTLYVVKTYAYCTKEMIKYLKKHNAILKERI